MLVRRMRRAAALALGSVALAAPAAAQAAPTWQDGVSQSSYITNCASIIFNNPYTETGANSYVGFYADPNDLPDTGQIYYVHTVFVALGNSCSGQYGYPELTLPPGTQLAIGAQTPVFCYALDFTQNPATATRDTVNCPQQPSSAVYGGQYGFGNTSGQNGGAWPMPQGKGWEIQVPVVSSGVLRGTAASPCDCLRGYTKMLDGNSSPVLQPSEGVFVEAAPPPQGGGDQGGGDTGGGGDSPAGPSPQAPHPDMPGSAMTPNSVPVDGGGTAGDGSGAGPVLAPPSVARSLRLSRFASRGLPFTISIGEDGTRVEASLTAGGIRASARREMVIARVTRRRAGRGRLTLNLKPSRKAAKALRRKRVVRATLHVTVIGPTGMAHMLPPKRVTLKR